MLLNKFSLAAIAIVLLGFLNNSRASQADRTSMLMADADLVLLNCQGLVVMKERNYLELSAQWHTHLVQSSDPIDRSSLLAGHELYIEKNALNSDSRLNQMEYCVRKLIRLKAQLGDKSPFEMK